MYIEFPDIFYLLENLDHPTFSAMASSPEMDNISYPPCKKGIRPGICVKSAVSHEAGGRV